MSWPHDSTQTNQSIMSPANWWMGSVWAAEIALSSLERCQMYGEANVLNENCIPPGEDQLISCTCCPVLDRLLGTHTHMNELKPERGGSNMPVWLVRPLGAGRRCFLQICDLRDFPVLRTVSATMMSSWLSQHIRKTFAALPPSYSPVSLEFQTCFSFRLVSVQFQSSFSFCWVSD